MEISCLEFLAEKASDKNLFEVHEIESILHFMQIHYYVPGTPDKRIPYKDLIQPPSKKGKCRKHKKVDPNLHCALFDARMVAFSMRLLAKLYNLLSVEIEFLEVWQDDRDSAEENLADWVQGEDEWGVLTGTAEITNDSWHNPNGTNFLMDDDEKSRANFFKPRPPVPVFDPWEAHSKKNGFKNSRGSKKRRVQQNRRENNSRREYCREGREDEDYVPRGEVDDNNTRGNRWNAPRGRNNNFRGDRNEGSRGEGQAQRRENFNTSRYAPY